MLGYFVQRCSEQQVCEQEKDCGKQKSIEQ
jgi:hypothetical protein